MRNIFDSYSKNEDKLTHALFSTLDSDKDLLDSFMKDICGLSAKTGKLSVSVQSYPSDRAYTNKEIKSRSLPDAWIYDSDEFVMVFESKITDSLTQGQLAQHQRTADIRGFRKPRFYTITALSNAGDFDGWKQITWVSIYTWLRQAQADYPLARHTADYFEILESRMHSKKSSQKFKITTFTGFDPYYDNVFNYDLAKNTMRKAMDELRENTYLIDDLDMAPNSGRGVITSKDKTVVWDFLAMGEVKKGEETRKDSIHLTLGISDKNVEATITIPDDMNTYQRDKIRNRGEGLNEEDGKANFIELCEKIFEKMKPILKENSGAKPILRGLQRHSPRQGSYELILDTIIEADLRTVFENNQRIKHQPQWLDVIYDVFCNKKSNYQVQIGMYFPYNEDTKIKAPNATNLVAGAWLACEPLISLCK